MPVARSVVVPALAVAALALSSVSCASSKEGPREAKKDFAALEKRLLEAPVVHSTSHLVAEGAVTANVVCVHTLARDGHSLIKIQGTLSGKAVDMTFVADGGTMTVTGSEGQRELAEPADLRGGLLLGLTRMGWLHNVAMLAAGGWPDATDGKIDDFVRAVDVMTGDEYEEEEDGRAKRALTFGIEVKGQSVATAVLWIDCESGVPIERWQRVRMPGGEMRVVETYETFTLDFGGQSAPGCAEG